MKSNRNGASPPARPKIQDVAALAAVSLGAVSAVLNGNGRLSASTRKRVQSAIRRLGYRPDLYASNLARRRTRVLGIVVSSLQNPFFSETAQAIEEEAATHGYQISLMATNFSPVQQRAAVERLLGARVSGIAVITSEHNQDARRLVIAGGIPSVFLDVIRPIENSAALRVDSRGGMKAAVEHLIALGHRDILFVRNSREGKSPLLSHKLRDAGFAAAIRACGSPRLRAYTIDTSGSAADAGERAIASVLNRVRFTAIVAVTDVIAMGIYRGLQARELRIPHDVSVVGFDDVYFAPFLNPPLTTVKIPGDELSRMVIEALLKPAHPSRKQPALSLATSLVVRESTAPPNFKSGTMRLKASESRPGLNPTG
jgi:LacI family transcriptional regulator